MSKFVPKCQKTTKLQKLQVQIASDFTTWSVRLKEINVYYLRIDSSFVMMPHGTKAEADCITAWLKRFLDRGDSK